MRNNLSISSMNLLSNKTKIPISPPLSKLSNFFALKPQTTYHNNIQKPYAPATWQVHRVQISHYSFPLYLDMSSLSTKTNYTQDTSY